MRSLNVVWFGFTIRHGFGAEMQLIFYRKKRLANVGFEGQHRGFWIEVSDTKYFVQIFNIFKFDCFLAKTFSVKRFPPAFYCCQQAVYKTTQTLDGLP